MKYLYQCSGIKAQARNKPLEAQRVTPCSSILAGGTLLYFWLQDITSFSLCIYLSLFSRILTSPTLYLRHQACNLLLHRYQLFLGSHCLSFFTFCFLIYICKEKYLWDIFYLHSALWSKLVPLSLNLKVLSHHLHQEFLVLSFYQIRYHKSSFHGM